MSRVDLDVLQRQLKMAIQNHQTVVTKMKTEPQSDNLKKQLHDLQREIMILSEKQKSLVQCLRKELVSKKPVQQQLQPRPAHQQPVSAIILPTVMIQPRPTLSVMPVQNDTTIILQPTDLSVRAQPPNSLPLSLSQPVLQLKASSNNAHDVPVSEVKPTINTSPKSSPLKVPQYHLNRPSILQGSKSHQNGGLQIPLQRHSSVSSLPRTLSDSSDVTSDIRKTVEKKHFAPSEKKKMDFMACIDLVTPDTLKEMQNKRTERKRRTTANPQFCYNFDSERKRVSNFLLSSLPGAKRGRGRPSKNGNSPGSSRPNSPDSVGSSGSLNGFNGNIAIKEEHHDCCTVCGGQGQLMMCDTCSLVYHLQCLDPPLDRVPSGVWSCPKCQSNSKTSSNTLAVVHSFITKRSAKEEERKKLHRRQTELQIEISDLETKSRILNESINLQSQKQKDLKNLSNQKQQTVDNLKNFIKVFQS